MARRPTTPPPAGPSFGRILLYVLLISAGGLVLYKYYQNNAANYTSVPRELQINYVPSNFQLKIDEEETLHILSNPRKYRKEFNQLVYDLNISILRHVANRMDLGENMRLQIEEEYEKHHSYMRDLYFNDFLALKDTTSNLYQTWYENESITSAEILREVSSKYTCFLVNHILSTLMKTEEGSIYAKGMNVDTPCGLALTEALQPMMKRLEERAAIRDFSRSRALMQEKVERVIAELATMEVRDKKGLSKKLQTKVWGYSISTTDIEVSAISILKVGFRINEYFDINLNTKTGIVTLTLPEPTILSHEVYPKFDRLDIGWLREVQDVDLNRAFNVLREDFRRDALESDIMERSKAQAIELMNTMFTPLLASLDNRYQLKVTFRSAAPAEDTDFTARDLQN